MLGLTSMDPTWQAIHEDGTDFPGDQHPIVVARLTGRVVADTIVGVRRRDGTVVWLSVTGDAHRGSTRPGWCPPRKDGSRVWVKTVSEVLPATKDQSSYRIVRARNIDAQVRAQQELELRARTDALTGLLSRHAGWQQLRSDLDRERRSGVGLAVLFVDLDGFKAVNDERGHQVGDVLLYAIGTRLKATVRDEDYVVRIGGDEILVVLNGVSDLTAALEVAENVRRAVALPTAVDGSSVTVTASIGATQSRPGESVVELVHRADRAMYQAKQTGKDQVFAIA
jgi:diguanylate cyclase (GGDEF)-like protein